MYIQSASTENIKKMLEKLSTFNSSPEYGTTRVLFTEPELQAREYIKSEMKNAGLEVREDAIGNIFAKLEGEEKDLPVVWTGSHIDTVLNAGNFDGMAGVIAGIEALRVIKESNSKVKRSIEVLVYTSEEPTRFGLSCLGSRAMAGKLSLEEAGNLKDEEGKSLTEVLESLGYNLDEFDKIPVKKGDVHAAVELHIEQGGVLERIGKTIGVVKGISGPSAFNVTIKGMQSHAGGTPMIFRKDVIPACCEIALEIERVSKESASEDTVATVGKIDVLPNASNVISGEVVFSIDIRDVDDEVKRDCIEKIFKFIKEVEERRGLKIEIEKVNDDLATPSDEGILKVLDEVCEERSIDYHKMVSGAYHDSMMVGKFAPMAMLFVPSQNGISHSPDEWTEYEDIARGTDVLASALLKLSNQ
jgi:hydantoinase/carbamoylase family amidase